MTAIRVTEEHREKAKAILRHSEGWHDDMVDDIATALAERDALKTQIVYIDSEEGNFHQGPQEPHELLEPVTAKELNALKAELATAKAQGSKFIEKCFYCNRPPRSCDKPGCRS